MRQIVPKRWWASSQEHIHFEVAQSGCFPPNSWITFELKRYLILENIYFSTYIWALPLLWEDYKLSPQILLSLLHRNKIVAKSCASLGRHFLPPLRWVWPPNRVGRRGMHFLARVLRQQEYRLHPVSLSLRKQMTQWRPTTHKTVP